MPTTWNGMTRAMIQGVPVWKNTEGALFAYDTEQPPLKIGQLEQGFAENWKELYAERLAAYREGTNPRSRASATAPAQKK